MTEIKESRVVKIRDKVVTLKDIRRLAYLLAREAESADPSERNWFDVSFTVETFDGASFQSSDPSLFSENSPVTRLRAKKIDLLYKERAKDKRVAISIEHGDGAYSNSVAVSGTDSRWVNGTIAEVEETISSIRPQNTFVARWGSLISVATAISAGAILSLIIAQVLIFVSIEPPSEPDGTFFQLLKRIASVPLGYYVIKYGLYYIAGFSTGFVLMNKLKSLWPSVELQVGPEHEYIEKQRRLWVSNAVVLGLIPFGISVVYDVIRAIGA